MPVPVSELSKLFPLDALRPESREQLASEATVDDYVRKDVVFRAGDMDDHT